MEDRFQWKVSPQNFSIQKIVHSTLVFSIEMRPPWKTSQEFSLNFSAANKRRNLGRVPLQTMRRKEKFLLND